MAGDIIHLIGFPGVGKLTIAKEIVRLRPDCVPVDNHLINNPIFSVVRADGRTRLDDGVWVAVSRIRDVVLGAMETLSPPGTSFVMTNIMLDDDADRSECAKIEAVATRRGGRYFPVVLTCGIQENRRRIVNPERRVSLKCIDSEEPDRMTRGTPLIRFGGQRHHLSLDITTIDPREAAAAVLAWVDRPEDS